MKVLEPESCVFHVKHKKKKKKKMDLQVYCLFIYKKEKKGLCSTGEVN